MLPCVKQRSLCLIGDSTWQVSKWKIKVGSNELVKLALNNEDLMDIALVDMRSDGEDGEELQMGVLVMSWKGPCVKLRSGGVLVS